MSELRQYVDLSSATFPHTRLLDLEIALDFRRDEEQFIVKLAESKLGFDVIRQCPAIDILVELLGNFQDDRRFSGTRSNGETANGKRHIWSHNVPLDAMPL